MIPLWKVKREFTRIKDKLNSPAMAAVFPIAARLHDKTKVEKSRVTIGTAARNSNVALLLLFQPAGLADSVYVTCEALKKAGFAVFAVSNVPLSDADRARLSMHCFEILERPNFGYDFGGYRDGVLHLLDKGIDLQRLFVLNDSCWFPTALPWSFLTEVATTDADMFGAVSNSRRDGPKGIHLQSYAFSFGPKLIANPDFRLFWESLVVANNRFWTVEKCEMAMSPWFEERGYDVRAAWSFADIDALIPDLSIAELESILTLEASMKSAKQAGLRKQLRQFPHDSVWADEVREMMLDGRMRRYLLLAHPLLLQKIGFPFLKKNREAYYTAQRQEFLEMAPLHISAAILDEIRARDAVQTRPIKVVSQTAGKAA